MENMGKRIDQAQEEYQTLSSTRSKMLERPLKQIEDLKRHTGITKASLIKEVDALETKSAKIIEKTS